MACEDEGAERGPEGETMVKLVSRTRLVGAKPGLPERRNVDGMLSHKYCVISTLPDSGGPCQMAKSKGPVATRVMASRAVIGRTLMEAACGSPECRLSTQTGGRSTTVRRQTIMTVRQKWCCSLIVLWHH